MHVALDEKAQTISNFESYRDQVSDLLEALDRQTICRHCCCVFRPNFEDLGGTNGSRLSRILKCGQCRTKHPY